MYQPLPDRPPLDHPAVGQRNTPADSPLRDAVDAAIREELGKNATRYCNDSPLPETGSTPPVAQPGRPPMSQAATDASVKMITGGFLTLCIGVSASAILHFSGDADPVVMGCLCATPPVVFLSFKGLVKAFAKGAKEVREAAPPEIHNHNSGPVYQDQRNVTTNNKLWGHSSTNL